MSTKIKFRAEGSNILKIQRKNELKYRNTNINIVF